MPLQINDLAKTTENRAKSATYNSLQINDLAIDPLLPYQVAHFCDFPKKSSLKPLENRGLQRAFLK